MAEEKKEDKKEDQTEQKPDKEAGPETAKAGEGAPPPVSEPQDAAPAQGTPPPKDEKKEPPKAPREKPSNCAGCNKSIRKKRWYYRNGKFYCSQRCWKTSIRKKEASAESSEAKK